MMVLPITNMVLDLPQTQALIDALPIPIWVKDAQSRVLMCNQTAVALLGLPFAALVGTRGERFLDAGQMERTVVNDRAALASGAPSTCEEYSWSTELQANRWWSVYRKPLFDAQGQVAQLVSITIEITEQKRLQTQLAGERHLLEMLHSDKLLPEVLDAFACSYESTFPGMMSSVLLLDPDGQHLRHGAGPSLPADYCAAIDGVAIGMGVGSCGTAAFTGQEVLVADIANDPLWNDFNALALSHGLQACWSIPIMSTKGKVLGTFANYHPTPCTPTAEELITMRRGAYMAGLAIEYHHTQDQLAEGQRSLRESAQHTQAILDNMADGVVTFNSRGVIESFNNAACNMFGYSPSEVIGHDIAMLTPRTRDVEYTPFRHQFLNLTALQSESLTIEFEGLRKDRTTFPMALSVSKIASISNAVGIGILRDITERRQTEEEIRRLAFYDPLTELPNRRLLIDRLQKAMMTSARSGQHGAVMFLDLDYFKQLNDSLGHDIGDILLQQVAARLKASVREIDSVARLGGDEFVVLLESLSTDAQEAAVRAETIGNKLLAALAQPYALREHAYTSTPSIGVALFLGTIETIEALLKRADIAMYQAKAAGRNTLRFFDPVTQANIDAQAELERDLRRGLHASEFVLYYQPQVNVAGAIIGNEALVRWMHPTRGMVPPGQFIALAELTGVILHLGQWVLESACAQLVVWAAAPDTAQWTLAVNVSASQFTQPEFVSYVESALTKTGANPACLKLELTESMLVDDVEDIIVKMNAIKAFGVGFSLDDFGTGYSSLSYLKRLPLDQLKIDQSFVRDVLTDPSDAVIARTVVVLGHSLGLTVIAEGVETAEQAHFLSEIGCDGFQGYFYGRPVPAKATVP